MDRIVRPAERIKGTLTLPGDKSISHRALLLGALAEGTTEITNLSPGQDVQSTSHCLSQLGVKITTKDNKTVVQGRGLYGFQYSDAPLDAGNSGTTMRLLSGILAAQSFPSIITGDASLRVRPMARIIEPLQRMGAKIESEPGGLAPLRIQGCRQLRPIAYASPVASAQVKSCVLLAGLFSAGKTSVKEPSLSRDHTERMLPCFGVPLQSEGLEVGLTGPVQPKAASVDVPGDISSAAFFMVAAALLKGSEVVLTHTGTNPTRTGILRVLDAMGCSIAMNHLRIQNGEPRADVIVRGSRLRKTDIHGSMIPQVIDEIPILAVAATRAEGETTIRNARELRMKETDRIRAIVQNLRAMGAHVEELEDGLVIPGSQTLKGAVVSGFGDHRIAMAFAVAGLLANSETTIRDAECVDISFPGFFQILEGLAYV